MTSITPVIASLLLQFRFIKLNKFSKLTTITVSDKVERYQRLVLVCLAAKSHFLDPLNCNSVVLVDQ